MPEFPKLPQVPDLPNLLKEYIPDVPQLPDGQLVIKQVLGIGKYFNPAHPNFPVAICTVFILILGTTVIILRVIWKKLKPKDKSIQQSKSKDDKRQESKSQVAPTPASRWKRQAAAQEKVETPMAGVRSEPKWKKPAMPPEKPERQNGNKKVEKEKQASEKAASPSLTSKIAKGFNILKNLSPKMERKSEQKSEPSPKNSPKLKPKKEETPKSSPKLMDRIFGNKGSSPLTSKKEVPKIEVTQDSTTEKKEEFNKSYEENSKILSNLKSLWGGSGGSSSPKERTPSPVKQPESKPKEKSKSPVMPARVIHLNIEKDGAKKTKQHKKAREEEIKLVKTMGKEFREIAKLDNPESREERRQEMEKVKSARTYFKTVEKMQQQFERDNSINRFDVNNENLEGTGLSVRDLNIVKRRSNFFQSIERNNPRLSQFEPGKLNKKISNVFEGSTAESEERGRAPRKKLISENQVFKQDEDLDVERKVRQREIEELREARKNWVPPEDSPQQPHPSIVRSEFQVEKGSVTKRWQKLQDDRKEQEQSAQGEDLDKERHERQKEIVEMKEARKSWVPPEDSPQEPHSSAVRLEVQAPGRVCVSPIFMGVEDGPDAAPTESAPKKKLISENEVFKQEEESDLERKVREREIEEIREARKNWVPPEDSPQQPHSSIVRSEVQGVTDGPDAPPAEKELPRKREPGASKVTDRWIQHTKQESPQGRSRSAHAYQRNKLPDTSWLQEKVEVDDSQRRKTLMELELIKKAREELDDEKIYDFTTTRMEERRREALMELETVKSLRKNRPEENIFDVKEDPRDQRKQEIENVMKMRSSGKEYVAESTPSSKSNLERSKSAHTVKFQDNVVNNHEKTDKKVSEKLEKKKGIVASKVAKAEESDETAEQKNLASCLMDKFKVKGDVKDALSRSESFFKDKLKTLSVEKKESKDVDNATEDVRSKSPSFMDKVKLRSKSKEKAANTSDTEDDSRPSSFVDKLKFKSKSKEKVSENEDTAEPSLMGKIRGRSMERKADIYAKIKETREIVQNTEKAWIEKFENTERAFTEKIDQIRSKSQEKKQIPKDTDPEVLSALRTEIIKTEVANNMYKVSSLEREKSRDKKKSTGKTSKSSSTEKVQDKKVKKSGSSEMKEKPKTSVISKYSKALSNIEDKASHEIKHTVSKISESASNVEKAISNIEHLAADEIKHTVNKISESTGCLEKRKDSQDMIPTYSKVDNDIKQTLEPTVEELPLKQEKVVDKEIVQEKKDKIEDLYSKVDKKAKKEAKDKALAQETIKTSRVPDVVHESVKVKQETKPVKSFLKPGEDPNKIDMDKLLGKIEKCDLKCGDSTKILPSRVLNCTPRPFTPFGGTSVINSYSPSFQSPSDSPMPPINTNSLSNLSEQFSPSPVTLPNVQQPSAFTSYTPSSSVAMASPSPIAFSSSPNITAQKPTPQLSTKHENKYEEITPKEAPTSTSSPFSKFVDSIQFPNVFDKSSKAEEPETFIATVETSSSQTALNVPIEKEKTFHKAEKFAKFIQKKTEKSSESTTTKSALSSDQPASIPQLPSSPLATNILTADLPDVANVTQKQEQDTSEDKPIVSKFKELKTKTMSEVSGFTSKTISEVSGLKTKTLSEVSGLKTKTMTEVSKLTRSRSVQKKASETRRESTNSDSKITSRTKSENRAQKAGKIMKDFTSSILKRR